jgi:purine-nucleoside phosphorylase
MLGDIERAADVMRDRGVPGDIETAIIFDWNFGGLLDGLETLASIPYSDLPGFPTIEMKSGGGKVVAARHEGRAALWLHGFACERDTGDPAAMGVALEILALAGVRHVALVSAAGSVRIDYFPGHLLLINDHIGLFGSNPLRGRADDGGYINLTEPYDGRLNRRFKRATISAGASMHEGISCQFPGPAFETQAKAKIARQLGADVVGQVIVPAVVLARRLGLNVAALAVITHYCAGFSGGNPSHGEIATHAQAATIPLRRLVRAFLKTGEGGLPGMRPGG